MPNTRTFAGLFLALLLAWVQPVQAQGAVAGQPQSTYILGDSIAYGLHLDGLEAKLQASLGGPARISFDGGRSLTTPGNQIKKTAFESVDADKATIASAHIIVIILGMNQQELNFADSQQQLMKKLKAIAPKATYYWVDIGGTISTQFPGWNQRNKIIYDKAGALGYEVISRYKTIFGHCADPLNIPPGINFPGWNSEPGYGGPGNIHGFYAELSKTILNALTRVPPEPPCIVQTPGSSYVLSDSIGFGLHHDRLGPKLQRALGGPSKISYDAGRSILTPGEQIKKSAMDSVEIDKAYIARASIIIIALGTNQIEAYFEYSLQQLIAKLKTIAPRATYYWVDLAATIPSQVPGWNQRNKVIYDNAGPLGYTVISRYKAIFGPAADPLNITPGKNFPGMETEPGFDGPGNVHGKSTELSQAIVAAVAKTNSPAQNPTGAPNQPGKAP